MRGAAGAHLEVQRVKLCALAAETLQTMKACFGLLGALENDIVAMDKVLVKRNCAATLAGLDLAVIDAKIVFYARVKDVECRADEEELLAAKLHVDSELVHRVLASTAGSLDMIEVEAFTLELLHRTADVKTKILGFQSRPNTHELWPVETKIQLEAVYRGLKRRNYTKVFPVKLCGVCLEMKVDCESCGNTECDGQICSACLGSQLFQCHEENFNDPEKLARVANLGCWFCSTGAMSSNIIRQMPFCDFELWEDCVRMQSMADKASEMSAEKARELAEYRGLSSFEKLFRLEKEIIGEMITTRCKVCSRAFGDFEGCAALTCGCGARICGLCFDGPFGDDENCHTHVANCPARPLDMTDALFIDIASWKRHVADRQQQQVSQYLVSTDGSAELKQRLREFFSAR